MNQSQDTTFKLHLGCGRNILPGFLNLDVAPLPGVDIVHDLSNASVPIPLPDDSVTEILASHLLEHIQSPLPLMQELHRVAVNGAKALFLTPYGSSDDAWEDPTHVRPYFLNSFRYFGQPANWRADYGYRGDWSVDSITLVMSKERYQGKSAEQLLLAVNHERNCVLEMRTTLVAIKPVRECKPELQEKLNIQFKLV